MRRIAASVGLAPLGLQGATFYDQATKGFHGVSVVVDVHVY